MCCLRALLTAKSVIGNAYGALENSFWQEKTELLCWNLSHYRFVYHKSQIDYIGLQFGPALWQADS